MSKKTVNINKITQLLGGDKVHIKKRPGEPDCTFADISKIKSDLNWKPEILIKIALLKYFVRKQGTDLFNIN